MKLVPRDVKSAGKFLRAMIHDISISAKPMKSRYETTPTRESRISSGIETSEAYVAPNIAGEGGTKNIAGSQ